MIGKPEWFKYRVFGWGIGPRTWQAWVYIAAAAALIAGSLAFTVSLAWKPWIFGVVFAIFTADVIHIMSQLPKVHDERENLQQLIIERNCSFAAITALVAVALYQAYARQGIPGPFGLPFDLSLVIVLAAMFATKVVSTIVVRREM